MTCQVLSISSLKPSKLGGQYRWYFLKDLETGRSVRCPVVPTYGNSVRWQGVKVGQILEGLHLINGSKDIVDADSQFRVKEGFL